MKTEVLNNDALTVRVNADPVLDTIESTLDVLDKQLDNIESGLDAVESTARDVIEVTKNNPFVLAGVALVALGVGGFVGYRIGVKRTTLHYEQVMSEEIEKAKIFYKRIAKTDEYETPEGAVEALHGEPAASAGEAVRSYRGSDEDRERPRGGRWRDEQKVVYNKQSNSVPTEPKKKIWREPIVEGTDDFVWDFDLEVADREANPKQPYVIHHDEFVEGLPSQDRQTLTYYAKDDVLADSREVPIDNAEYVICEDNLMRFGHGSGDRNVVYIRNEKIGTDFEVVRSPGSYQMEVLGTEPEIKHSRDRRPRKFRGSDE